MIVFAYCPENTAERSQIGEKPDAPLACLGAVLLHELVEGDRNERYRLADDCLDGAMRLGGLIHVILTRGTV